MTIKQTSSLDCGASLYRAGTQSYGLVLTMDKHDEICSIVILYYIVTYFQSQFFHFLFIATIITCDRKDFTTIVLC